MYLALSAVFFILGIITFCLGILRPAVNQVNDSTTESMRKTFEALVEEIKEKDPV